MLLSHSFANIQGWSGMCLTWALHSSPADPHAIGEDWNWLSRFIENSREFGAAFSPGCCEQTAQTHVLTSKLLAIWPAGNEAGKKLGWKFGVWLFDYRESLISEKLVRILHSCDLREPVWKSLSLWLWHVSDFHGVLLVAMDLK